MRLASRNGSSPRRTCESASGSSLAAHPAAVAILVRRTRSWSAIGRFTPLSVQAWQRAAARACGEYRCAGGGLSTRRDREEKRPRHAGGGSPRSLHTDARAPRGCRNQDPVCRPSGALEVLMVPLIPGASAPGYTRTPPLGADETPHMVCWLRRALLWLRRKPCHPAAMCERGPALGGTPCPAWCAGCEEHCFGFAESSATLRPCVREVRHWVAHHAPHGVLVRGDGEPFTRPRTPGAHRQGLRCDAQAAPVPSPHPPRAGR